MKKTLSNILRTWADALHQAPAVIIPTKGEIRIGGESFEVLQLRTYRDFDQEDIKRMALTGSGPKAIAYLKKRLAEDLAREAVKAVQFLEEDDEIFSARLSARLLICTKL